MLERPSGDCENESNVGLFEQGLRTFGLAALSLLGLEGRSSRRRNGRAVYKLTKALSRPSKRGFAAPDDRATAHPSSALGSSRHAGDTRQQQRV